MKRTKLLAILSILCMILTLFSTNSFAEGESFELQLEASTITLNPGDTFSVDIIIDNINVTSGDQGIGAYQTKIIYDQNVLEFVNVTAASGWEVFENEGNMVANTSTGEVVQERTNTATINFKVKDDAEIGNTTISLDSIQGSSGYTTIDGTGILSTINIEEENNNDNNTTGGNNTSGNNNTTGGNNTSGNNNTAGGSNTVENNSTTGGNGSSDNTSIRNNTRVNGSNVDQSTTANKTLPYAGFTSIIAIAVVISIISAIIFYIKYRRAV